jgi:hypothetical protein
MLLSHDWIAKFLQLAWIPDHIFTLAIEIPTLFVSLNYLRPITLIDGK